MADPASERSTKLYTPRLLSLAAELADYPYTEPFQHSAEVRSRTCGSVLLLGADLDSEGRVERIGTQVTACAVGQSSAAIMVAQAAGKSAEEFAAARAAVEGWLAGEGDLPDWPGFDALEPALAHPGRHGALLLPWNAAQQALSSAASSR